ncbi:MAG: CHASE domain-containing protein [Archangium sp.]|nr:CHASE domain-containing protein [Archangium sp.]MDP3575962.1 CHASE domain-containing protein [Archangium sp.]
MRPELSGGRGPAERFWLLPLTLFVSTLLTALTAALVTRDSLSVAARARMEQVADDAAERLKERLESAGSVARGTAGLFVAQERVNAGTFHAFVGAQSVTRWLAQGRVSWVVAPRPEEYEVVLARGRTESPKYKFHSPQPLYPVLFVSPKSKDNESVLGLDLATSEPRRRAIERARDEGEVTLISQFGLPIEETAPGSAVLHPVYEGRPLSLEERRAQFRGVVIVGAPTEDFYASAFAASSASFHVQVIDLADVAPLWSSTEFPPGAGPDKGVTRLLAFGGRELAVHLVPREGAGQAVERLAFMAIIGVGTLLAFSFAGLTFQQLRGRRAAERAQLITRAAFDEADRRRALLDLVVEQSSDGIIMADGHGVIRLFNEAAAQLYGVPRNEVLSPDWKPTYRVLTVEGATIPPEQAPLTRALRGELVHETRWVVHRPDGGNRVLTGTASPLKNPDGSSAGAVLVMRDETERLRAEAERERLIVALEFSNAELEQFASVASHDLKAPLRGISQLAQFLEEDLGDKLSRDDRQHLALLKGRVRRLVALIDGILGYARAGQSSETLETFDARDAASEALVLLAPPPGSEVLLPAPGLSVQGDKALLLQVLMNLLSNAFMHGAQGAAHIEVDAQADGSFVRFSVRDNGPGIAPEYHQLIWGMFQTLQPRDEKESTGIGLSVVRKVVQAQGGRAWVESALGHGATFFFTWPRQLKR